MGRQQITIIDLADKIGVNRDTMSRKLSGKSPLFFNEAFIIKREFFPEKDLYYLFKELATGEILNNVRGDEKNVKDRKKIKQ
jgi:plasmid maintenance system antidote protein VapI